MKFWIKLWIDTMHDPKMGSLSNDLWRRTIECLMMAGEKDEEGFLPTLEEMSWILRMQAEHLENDLVELQTRGILNVLQGRWFVNKFAERQRPSTSSERSKQHRKRQKIKHYQGNLWDANEPRTFRPTEERRGEDTNRGEEKESGVTKRDAENLIKCPRCRVMVYEHALDADCMGHGTIKERIALSRGPGK